MFLHPTFGLIKNARKPIGKLFRRAPLADSASSLYTTSFPTHSRLILRDFEHAGWD
jgi:hypothetical protein